MRQLHSDSQISKLTHYFFRYQAKHLGTTQSVVARLESGTSKHISLDYLVRILRVLGVTPEFKFKKVA
ncbi:MAG: helix-turn-helix transcriptional regulator [Oligoflexia bacterium]|nr:helix-turn-helix transcriptional regulator [Oligoflexia bacterium]